LTWKDMSFSETEIMAGPTRTALQTVRNQPFRRILHACN
jgi:hypothetical protein